MEEKISKQEQKWIIDTIIDFFKELFNTINLYINEHVLSDTAKKALEADADKANEIRQMVLDAWNGAIGEYHGNETNEAESTNYSIMVDENGNEIPTIEDKMFSKRFVSNNYNKVVKQKVKELLLNLDNESVIIKDNNRVVYFDRYFADEYTGSEDTFNSNDMRKTVKMNAVNIAREIVENAKYDNWKPNLKDKKVNADREFDYYYVTFAINNMKGKYDIFEGILNVRKDKNGKDYAYDIVKIKKRDLVTLYEANAKPGQQPIPKNTKTQNIEDVNQKYSINVKDVKELTSEDDNMLKEYFGTTKNFDVAGYMLKDGSMLDFSGRHWGDTSSKMRQVDHRDINEVLDEENYGDAMINMIANGNIRWMSESGGINLAVAPPKEQKDMMREYIKSFRGEVIVDFDEKGGNTVESITYDKGTDAEKVFSDIDNYFRGGRQSDLMRFHTKYSINIDDSLFEALEDTYASQEQSDVSIIEEGFQALMNLKVDQQMMYMICKYYTERIQKYLYI